MTANVYLHAWEYLEDEHGKHQTYCDDPAKAEGWCVYVAGDTEDGTIDILDKTEVDFPDFTSARSYAEALAQKYNTDEILEY